MNRPGLSVAAAFLLCVSCSDYRDNGWFPDQSVSPDSSQGRIHGDERSQSQRYRDCLAASPHPRSKAERSRCENRSLRPDPDYVGISVPLRF